MLLIWVLCYCAMGTAKGPFMLALIIAIISVLHFSTGHIRQIIGRLYVTLAVGAVIFVACVATGPLEKGTVLSGLRTKFETPQYMDTNRPYLIGDYARAQSNTTGLPEDCGASYVCRKTNYLVYRILLTPAEVSGRWYEYFALYPPGKIQFGRRIHDSRSGEVKHPALAVADWAFIEPFPREFTANLAYAYASIDADAFGRYGVWGVALVLLMYALIRLVSVVCHDMQAPTRGVYYLIVTALLAMLPSSASIQAMALPQGLAPVLGIMVLLYVWKRRTAIQAVYRGLRSTKV